VSKGRVGRTNNPPRGSSRIKRRFPRPIRDLVDCDYLDQLPEDGRVEHERFLQEYYNASFSDESPPVHDIDGKRDCYRAKNARNRDLYAIASCTQRLSLYPNTGRIAVDEDEERDLTVAPEYLDTDEYREARDEYREFLPVPARRYGKATPVEEDPKYQRALLRLRKSKK
jgi:hypothetical protein